MFALRVGTCYSKIIASLNNENTTLRTLFESTFASAVSKVVKDIIQKIASIDLKIKANVFNEGNQYSMLNLKLDLDPIAKNVFMLKYYVDANISFPPHHFLSLLHESCVGEGGMEFKMSVYLFSQVSPNPEI
jgi:gamma-tubulin complex component